MTSARISLSLVVDLDPPVWYLAVKNASSRALARLEVLVACRIKRVTSVLAQLFPSIPKAMTRPFLLLTALLPAAQRVSKPESQKDTITHGADHLQMCPLSEKQPAPVCANTLGLFPTASSIDVVPQPQLGAAPISDVLMAACISFLSLVILILALKCARQRPRPLRSLSPQITTGMQPSNSIEEVARLIDIVVSENLSVGHATQEWALFESENLQSRGGSHCTDRLVLDAQSLTMPATAAFLGNESSKLRRKSAAFDVERRLLLMPKSQMSFPAGRRYSAPMALPVLDFDADVESVDETLPLQTGRVRDMARLWGAAPPSKQNARYWTQFRQGALGDL